MSALRGTLLLLAALVAFQTAAARHEAAHSEAYRDGRRALDEKDWDRAARIFDKLAGQHGDETDAALYWKAYADAKRNHKQDALSGLHELLASYPQSSWAGDAKALELELRDRPREPRDRGKDARETAAIDDEDLKLYALDGLMQADPTQAIPVLEKILAGNDSPRIKQRALFVLSQGGTPRAREILRGVAKNGQPVELRCEAVKTLAIAGLTDDLKEVARDTRAPREVREAVVDAYLIADRPDELAAVATADPDPEIREKAINALGAIGGRASLRQLFATEKDPERREHILNALGVAGDAEGLAKMARESSDPETRRKAIRALMITGDAKPLIELFRTEKDPETKKLIIQQLSVMDDPAATRMLLEILGEKP